MRKTCFVALLVGLPAIANAQPAPTATTTTTSAAPPSPWAFGVGLRVGLDVPTAKLGPMAGGTLELDAATPVADHRLIVALGLGLTRPSHTDTVMDTRIPGGSASYTIHETELAIGVDAVFRIARAGAKLVPWVGAGPLLQLLRTSETTAIAPGTNTEQSTKVGAEAAGGVDLSIGPGFAVGDLRFRWSALDHDLTGKSNAGNLVVSVGYRLVF